jgi:hypothetical protein
VQLGAGEFCPAQPTGAVQGGPVDLVLDQRGGAEAGPLRRVELVNEDVDVLAGLVGADVARRGQQPKDVDLRVVQGQGDGERGVDAGVGDQDDFLRHACESLPGVIGQPPGELALF